MAPELPAPSAERPDVPGYRVQALLGEGGFARVFEAQRVPDGGVVALKVARPEAAGASTALAREAAVLRAVGPPTVPALLEIGRLAGGGTPFVAMERLTGPSLAQALEEAGGALEPAAVAGAALALLDALERLHASGFAHGDLKPENVVLAGEPPVARLLDLALAAPVESKKGPVVPAAEAPTGTPEYMAPEQWRGERPGPRTDLYAFGAMLLELITGRPPYLGAPAEVRYLHENLRPPLGGLPRGLSKVLEGCLAKSAADRPASARAVREALEPILTRGQAGARSAPARAAEPSAGARRTVGVVFLATSADAATLRAAAAWLGGVHAHASVTEHALVFDAVGVLNPVERALAAARAAVARGLTRRALVDLVPVLVRARPGGGERYLSSAFSQPDSWLGPDDPPGVLLTRRAGDHLPGLPLSPSPKRLDLLVCRELPKVEPTVVRQGAPPLLGRDDLLVQLLETARSAARDRAPTVAAVLGDAGMGKSHLAAVLAEQLRAERGSASAPAPEVVELRARAAEGADVLGLLLRWLLGVAPEATAPADAGRALLAAALAPDKLSEAWPAAALAMGWLEPGAPALAASGAAPGALASLAARAAAALLRRRSSARPLCLLLDDADQASGAALDALEQAALAEEHAAVLVLALATPGFLERRPGWGERAQRRLVERVEPLSQPAAEALCQQLLAPAEGIPAAALAHLAERAAGVPLLMVELVRGLRAAGLVRPRPGGRTAYLATDELDKVLDLPAVEWLAAAALRAMPPDLAAHAQLAALLGDGVVAAEAAGVLSGLVEAGLGPAFPLDAEAATRRLVEFGLLSRHRDGRTSFRLPVVRDAVARSTPEVLRRAIHEAAFRFHARPGPLPEVLRLGRLATHAAETGRRAEAGEACLELAADRAARHAYVEAEGFYSRALGLLDEGAARGRLEGLRGRGLMRSRVARHRDAVTDLDAAALLARALSDGDAERHALLDEATALDWMNDFASARDRVRQAAEVAGPVPPALQARLLLGQGRILFRACRWQEAVGPLEAAAAQAGALGDEGYETRVAALLLLGTALPYLGRIEAAEAALGQARDDAAGRGDLVHVAVALSNARNPALARGDAEGAAAGLRESIRIARTLGHLDSEYYARYNLAELHYHLEAPAEAAPHLERAEAIEAAHPEAAPGPLARLLRARLLLHAGDLPGAARALERYREARAAWATDTAPSEAVLADMVALATGGGSDADWEALLSRSGRDSVEQEPLEVLEVRAQAARREGRPEVARQALEAALALGARLPGPLTARIRRVLS
ncbi:MAG: protein kinase [Anaeromyxobacter sp.]